MTKNFSENLVLLFQMGNKLSIIEKENEKLKCEFDLLQETNKKFGENSENLKKELENSKTKNRPF